tara:strand:- start:61901 stop:62440 length:540 start_codon:yes stop_codon:yes gene_type:complete
MGSGHLARTPQICASQSRARPAFSALNRVSIARLLSLSMIRAVGKPSSTVKKFAHVIGCQFGEGVPARPGARFNHVRALSDLFDLLTARSGQQAKNDVFERYETNAHLHQFGLVRFRDLPAAILIDRAHGSIPGAFSDVMTLPLFFLPASAENLAENQQCCNRSAVGLAFAMAIFCVIV